MELLVIVKCMVGGVVCVCSDIFMYIRGMCGVVFMAKHVSKTDMFLYHFNVHVAGRSFDYTVYVILYNMFAV